MKFSTVFAAALSLGTALALPAGQHKAIEKKTDDVQGPIKSVLATVDDLKVTVHTEIETIAATITSGDVNDVVPVVKASLETIITEISGVVDGVVPLVLGIAGPISEGDLQIVLEIVTDVKDIVGDVQHEVTELVDVLGADVVALLEEQLKGVLATLSPLVSPILTLVYSVVGHVAEGNVPAVVGEILALADDLKATLSALLAPVTGLLGALLGGLLG